MSLVKTKELLEHATKMHYGVAAINTFNFETVKNALRAAEIENIPIIIQFFPGFSEYCPVDQIAYMAKSYAKDLKTPVAVHLDHSVTYDIAVGGMRDGFLSVMVDGSALPFEENIKLTTEVVQTAQIFDVDVEAELGHVGMGNNVDDIVNCDKYTKIDQAVEFVERTHCDALAVAVGNAHGPYIKHPALDFDRMKGLRDALKVPLVMHGCSGIPDEQMQRAVACGFSKFNIATEYFVAMYNGIQEVMKQGEQRDAMGLMNQVEKSMIDFVRSKLVLLNPKHITW